MTLDEWDRRRDLEGGKQLVIWIQADRREEISVENHTYYGGGYRIYVTDLDDDGREWIGTFETPDEATDHAIVELASR